MPPGGMMGRMDAKEGPQEGPGHQSPRLRLWGDGPFPLEVFREDAAMIHFSLVESWNAMGLEVTSALVPEPVAYVGRLVTSAPPELCP